mmetsp:Transcript_129065/g.413559  ORF Transcript_129065/g.413559 Transcript_129065/m.413559 type:complete len:250 (+) Transcript_129065:2318-3067(+)
MMKHVEEEAFDVRAIHILVRHDHETPIAQLVGVVVLSLQIQAHDLDDVLDLCVVRCLLEAGVSNVERLSSQREDAKPISTDDAETSNCKCLSTVSLRQDERALIGLFASSMIRILQLGNAKDPGHLFPCRLHFLAHVYGLLRLGPLKNRVDNAGGEHRLDCLFGNFAFRPELGRLQGHCLLRLRVEGRIHNQAIHEDPKVVADMKRLDLHATLVLRVRTLLDGVDKLVRHMTDVRAALGCVDGVDERDL